MLLKKKALYLLALISSFVAIPFSMAQTNKSQLDSVLKKYKSSALVVMKVDKKVVSEIIGKEITYNGEIHLAGKKFRLKISSPEESMILFDGKIVWSVQFPPKELPGPVQVTKSQSSKEIQKQSLLSLLLGNEKLESNFEILKSEEANSLMEYKLKPIKEDLKVKDLVLAVDLKSKELRRLNYTDDIDNKTELSFSEIKFNKRNTSEKIFKYTPPKDAQVTEL